MECDMMRREEDTGARECMLGENCTCDVPISRIEIEIANAYASHGAILAADGDGLISAALREARLEGARQFRERVLMRTRDHDLYTAILSMPLVEE